MKAALALCLLTTGCFAQQSPNTPDNAVASIDPAFAADIKRLMEDAAVDKIMSQMLDQSLAATTKNLKSNPSLSPEFLTEFVRRYKARMLDGHTEDMLLHEYAKLFTPEDIKQMIAYQESPVGRKAVKLMPQIMSDLFQQGASNRREVGIQVVREIAKEHPEYLKKPQDSTVALAPSSGAAGGVVGAVLGGVSPASQPKEVKGIQPITKVNPDYPPLAKSARVQGTVIFMAVIGTDGRVEDLQLISGHPLLVQAAKDAVLQWVYEPVMLNDKPVKAITEINVNFTLGAANDSTPHT